MLILGCRGLRNGLFYFRLTISKPGSINTQCKTLATRIIPSDEPLQLTVAVVKPDLCLQPLYLDIIRRILISSGFLIVRTKRIRLSENEAQLFYKEHSNKFFYNRLVGYISSGYIFGHIIARQDAILLWRKLMGPTQAFRAQYEAPDTIRGSFGLSDTRNGTHGSDSVKSAEREMAFFFPNFNSQQWYQEDEIHFRRRAVALDRRHFVHLPLVKIKKW